MICLVDNSEHSSLRELLKHLKSLGITQERYFTEFSPQRDLGTGEVIPYKSPPDRYIKTEFANKNSLKRWLQSDTKEARQWAIDWLKKRRVEKSLIYPPTQVELRSLIAPSILYYEWIGGYNNICSSVGYRIRFDGHVINKDLPSGSKIVIDTREQHPLNLKISTVREALPYGDYALKCPDNKGIYIERKSISDFVGTLSDRKILRVGSEDTNLERFTRELERASEADSYIIMLVEVDINDALNFDYLPGFIKRCPKKWNPVTQKIEQRYTGVKPDHVFKNLRILLQSFHNFQALFVDGREKASSAVIKLLAMGDTIKKLDLQYQQEAGRLIF